jgi:hypothetical protein
LSLRLVDELRQLKDSWLHPGADAAAFTKLESDLGIVLPSEHQAVLQQSNGIEVYAGYIRLFGVGATEGIDAVIWNQPEWWKFAWDDKCSGYWCFAETAFGDQYAYALDSLRAGAGNKVYFLDALSMTPEIVASSFDEFLAKEFVRLAKDPYDAMIKQARQKRGPIAARSHLVYVPSILLGGTEDIDCAQEMDSRSAMICNGDIATQLDAAPSGKAVKGVETYEDALSRMRIRLVWE